MRRSCRSSALRPAIIGGHVPSLLPYHGPPRPLIVLRTCISPDFCTTVLPTSARRSPVLVPDDLANLSLRPPIAVFSERQSLPSARSRLASPPSCRCCAAQPPLTATASLTTICQRRQRSRTRRWRQFTTRDGNCPPRAIETVHHTTETVGSPPNTVCVIVIFCRPIQLSSVRILSLLDLSNVPAVDMHVVIRKSAPMV